MAFKRNLISKKQFLSEYNELYNVQREAIDRFLDYDLLKKIIAKVILPTGTGKTRIAEFFAAYLINKIYEIHHRPAVFAVACHRLMLANNLMGRILSSVKNKFGVSNFKIVVVNSGKYNRFTSSKYSDEAAAKKIWSTYGLSPADIAYAKNLGSNLDKQVNAWVSNGFNVLFVVLYHSMSTIKDSGVNFDFIFCDEAHITTEANFASKIGDFIKMSRITLHFTATPTTTDDPNGGMENKEIYGETLIFKKPVNVVFDKLITPIKVVLHELVDKDGVAKNKPEVGSLSNHEDITNSIMNGYRSLEKRCLDDQRRAGVLEEDLRKPVLFVSLGGGKIMEEYKDFSTTAGNTFFDFRKENDIDLYMTKSTKGFNGIVDYPEKNELEYVDLPKEEFLDKMDLIETERAGHGAIIINIDQLSEGIDLPAIDGVMIFRNLSSNPAKLLQIIGRSVRRANVDRHLIKDNSIRYDDWNKFVKPFSYVYLPISTYDESTKKDICRILMNLYDNYGDIIFRLMTREDMEGNEKKDVEQEDGMQHMDKETMKRKYHKVNSREYIMNILNNEFNEKSVEEYLNEISKMLENSISKSENDSKEKTKLEHLFNLFSNSSIPDSERPSQIHTYMLNHGFAITEINLENEK